MYVFTLGSKRQKKSYIGNIFYSIREHFDEWVSIQYLLTNEMSELKLSFPYPALSFHFITYTLYQLRKIQKCN